jgi:hypothetical protein
MKLATMFTLLSVTILAIARAENGTRQLLKKKKKKKNKFKTKAIDVRLQVGASTSLLKHGPIELFVQCVVPTHITIFVVVRNDSNDEMGVFGENQFGGFSDSVDHLDFKDFPFADFYDTGNVNGMASIGTSTGFYLSLDGETAIGLIGAGLSEYGEDVDCVFMGVFTMFKKKAPKVVLVR